MTDYISIIEKDNLEKFTTIYNEFLDKFYFNISAYVNQKYVDDLNENYTNCLNYSIDFLDETLKEDEINYQKYLYYINISNTSSDDNLTSDTEAIEFINKTEILLYCHDNNYFNYSIKLYKEFEEKYKNKLNYLINNITEIDLNDLDEKIMHDYLENNSEYVLENFTKKDEVFEDLKYNYLSYEDLVIYINYTQNNLYFNLLYDLLVDSFKPSYTNYFNNYLISPLIENITIFINAYIEMHLDYLSNKIEDEFNYYHMILNNTKELGVNSINALASLYDNVKMKINESIHYTITEYILFYINSFYRKNKNIFSNHYITYYANQMNEYKIQIYQLNEIIDKIIYDETFNKTIKNISSDLMDELIINQMNNTINQIIDNKISQVYYMVDELKNKMEIIISNIEQNEDNQNVNKIINEYKIILLNQNNQFIFKVSDIPFNQLYSFLKDVLEPPILEIKKEYESIEEYILENLQNVINTSPDFKEIIKEKLDIQNTLDYIKLITENIKNLLLQYYFDIDDDYDTYINQLIHYTYINGTFFYDKPCDFYNCSFNLDQIKSQPIRRLQSVSNNKIYRKNKNKNKNLKQSFKINEMNINMTEINEKRNKKIDFKRKLTTNTFDSTMGSLSKHDVIPMLLNIKDTIYKLNETYINFFDTNIKRKTDNYIMKVNVTHMIRLDRTITTSISQFAPILSKDSYQKLYDSIYKEYYKLEDYLANITNILEKDIRNLIKKLKKSSLYLAQVNNISFNKIIAYLNIFREIIDSKYEMITDDNKEKDDKEITRSLDSEGSRSRKKGKIDFDIHKNQTDYTINIAITIIGEHGMIAQEYLNNTFEPEEEEDKDEEDGGNDDDSDDVNDDSDVPDDYSDDGDNNCIDTDCGDDEICLKLSKILCELGFRHLSSKIAKNETSNVSLQIPPFVILFKPFPILQLRLGPTTKFSLTFEVGANVDGLKNEYNTFLDVNGNSEVSSIFEITCQIPPFSAGVQISLSVGINGILGSGKIGMKLYLYINEPKIEIDIYTDFNAHKFSFYILFKVKVNLGFIKFSFSFYLMKVTLLGYEYSTKIKKVYQLPNYI